VKRRASETAFVEGVDYRRTGHPVWKYELLRDVRLTLDYPLAMRKNVKHHHNMLYRVTDRTTVVLRKGYRWNGSNVVRDLVTDMRASALHDLEAQLMLEGIVWLPTLSNWWKAALEYAHNCVADGMSYTRACLRFIGIL